MISELLEDFKEANDANKEEFKNNFKTMLWESPYKLKTYKRFYTYKINEKSLNHRPDLIDLFNEYKEIEFTFCKSFYNKKLKSIDYIRIHVNNMYGYLVNKNIYLNKEYYQLLLAPKKEYYSTIKKLKNNEEVNCEDIKTKINASLLLAENIKVESINKKLDIKWTEYKKIINTYIDRLFINYTPLHEYEKIHGWEMNVNVDGWNEDNYVIRYFCKSLTGYMRNYVASLAPKEIKKKYCANCAIEITVNSNRQKYCSVCWEKREKELRVRINKQYYASNKIKTV